MRLRTPRAAPVFAVAMLALSLTAAGCGSGASTTTKDGGARAQVSTRTRPASAAQGSGTAPSTARARFVAQADAICARYSAKIAALKPKSDTPAEVERIVPRHVALERAAIARLQKLAPPSALQSTWRRVLSARRTLASELVALLAAAKRHDTATIAKLRSEKSLAHLTLSSGAKGGGFKHCGDVGA